MWRTLPIPAGVLPGRTGAAVRRRARSHTGVTASRKTGKMGVATGDQNLRLRRSEMRRKGPKHLQPVRIIVAAALAIILEMAAAAALAAPSADEIVKKFLTLRASSPKISVADISVALRTKVPVTQPPTCAYVGKFNSTGARYAITIEREVRASPVCKMASSHRDNLLEVVRETMEAVAPLPAQAEAALKLDRFDLAVRDQKVVGVGQGSDYFYLLD